MSETNTYTNDFGEEFKARLKLLPFVVIVYVIAYSINKGLWTLDSIVILSVIVALIPIKLIVIVLRFFQLWRTVNKKVFLLLFLPIIFILAFLFDFETVPDLWAYRLGIETQGNAIELIKTNTSHFIVYEFSVDNVSFKKQQEVSIPYYESLSPGSKINVKYNPGNPSVSFLVDVQYLKNQTITTLFMGFGVIVAMFASELQEKLRSILENGFCAKKPT